MALSELITAHDVLMICDTDPRIASEEDKKALGNLGFFISSEYGEPAFISFRYGSA